MLVAKAKLRLSEDIVGEKELVQVVLDYAFKYLRDYTQQWYRSVVRYLGPVTWFVNKGDGVTFPFRRNYMVGDTYGELEHIFYSTAF